MATVDSLVADARTYAASAYQASQKLVDSAQSIITGLTGGFYVNGPTGPTLQTVEIDTAVPEFGLPAFDPGAAPAAPTNLYNLPDLSVGAAPVDTSVDPGFVEPAKPAPLHALDFTPPTINTDLTFPDLPAPLQLVDVAAPTLPQRSAPDAPQLQLPEFVATKPTDDITPPSDYREQFEAAYRSAAPSMIAALDGQLDAYLARINPRYDEQLGALEDRLANLMATGNLLKPEIEDALYQRARDKNHAEYKRTRETLFSDVAKRGFTLPPAAILSGVQEARQAAADNNARAATDIVIKQAELAQQNIQFSITASAQLRATALNASLSYHGQLVQINGQALDYAKAVLQAAIEVYDTLVKAYSVRLEAYKAEAAVYETRLKGVLAVIDIYKAEIEALNSLTRLDLAQVEIYKTRLEGLNTLASVYRSQIDAVIGQATVEKMKIELFGAEVQAYATEAQAKNAEWQGYTAAVGGQEARVRAYGEQIRAYGARVEAYRAEVAAKATQVQSITSYNDGLIRQYVANVEGYRAKVDASSRVVATQIDYNRGKLQAFQAKIGAQEANARLIAEYYKTRATIDTQQYSVLLQAAVESARQNTAQIEATANVAISGAKVYEGLAASALAGMNTLVSQTQST